VVDTSHGPSVPALRDISMRWIHEVLAAKKIPEFHTNIRLDHPIALIQTNITKLHPPCTTNHKTFGRQTWLRLSTTVSRQNKKRPKITKITEKDSTRYRTNLVEIIVVTTLWLPGKHPSRTQTLAPRTGRSPRLKSPHSTWARIAPRDTAF